MKHWNIPVNSQLWYILKFGSPTVIPAEVIRATEEEKQYQIDMLNVASI
jgi:methylmalonyl-CoA mutase